MTSQRSVLVVGSINVDVVIKVKDIPAPGETVHGSDPIYLPGGKGGNQAVSVAHNGARSVMVSAVGDDDFGKDALVSLRAYGVNVDQVETISGTTGAAYIYVDARGENSIVVAPGANGKVKADTIEQRIRNNANADSVILCQMELPLPVVEMAAKTASEIGARFILNLAPAIEIGDELLSACDPIIVNESEAELLSGQSIKNLDDAKATISLLTKRAKSAVITLGPDGAVFSDGAQVQHLPSEKVSVVDTTGAGDAFVGALAAAFANGADFESAVRAGLKAGAAAVQHFGAQPPRG